MTNDAIFEAIRQYIEQDKDLSNMFFVINAVELPEGALFFPTRTKALVCKNSNKVIAYDSDCSLDKVLFALVLPSDSGLSDEGADDEYGRLQEIKDEIFKLATRIFIAELETDLDCNFNRAVEELQGHQEEMRQKAIKEAEAMEDDHNEYMKSQCEPECNNDAFDGYDKICNGGK